MFELRRVPSDVVGCYGRPAVLDRLAEAARLSLRVAPDELLYVGERNHLAALEAELASLDAGGVIFDLSSAYALWALRGDDRFEAFRRLSQLALPKAPAVLQGLVAHVPMKIVVRADELLLVVSSVLSHHLRERVLRACANLAPHEEADVPEKEAALEKEAPA